MCFTGIAASLKSLLTDSDITVRQKSTECLYVLGSKFIIEKKKTELNYFTIIIYLRNREVSVERILV